MNDFNKISRINNLNCLILRKNNACKVKECFQKEQKNNRISKKKL